LQKNFCKNRLIKQAGTLPSSETVVQKFDKYRDRDENCCGGRRFNTMHLGKSHHLRTELKMTNLKWFLVFVFVLALVMVLGCGKKGSGTLDLALKLYNNNELEKALPAFQRAVDRDPRDPEAYAYLAETYRRLGRTDSAVMMARKAIELDPCQSFAHTVLADAYNPQYAVWDGANSDTTWNHLMKAVTCNENDGNAWMSIWTEAMHRGDNEYRKKALQMLSKSGFLTPTTIAINRWILNNLPEKALLITNGDFDTYPAAALQEVNQFRPDVAVVNEPLLNTSWYARFIRDHYGVQLPFKDSELDSTIYNQDGSGRAFTPSKQIFRKWLDQKAKGELSNPIAISVTVDEKFFSDIKDHLKLAGPFWLWYPEKVNGALDTTAMRANLTSVRPEDFTGPCVSPQDRSPIRKVYSDGIVTIVTAAALQYADALISTKRIPEALDMLKWAEEFEKKTVAGPRYADAIKNLRQAAGGEKK
jgi:tetratricopeptide (TPR) repeat protein